MGLEVKSIKCPNCGASLSVEEGRKSIFCTYCGSKLELHDSNEYTVHIHDEAGVKAAETERIVQLKKIEMMKEGVRERKSIRELKVKISIALAVIGVIMLTIAEINWRLTSFELMGFLAFAGIPFVWIMIDDNPNGDSIRVPFSIGNYQDMSYKSVEQTLRSAGFTNITCVGLEDLTFSIKKRGKVESITINGKSGILGGRPFPKDAKIVISYHSQR